MIFRVESYSYKQSSFDRRQYFSAFLNKGRKTACSFVTSQMTGYKDTKHSLIGHVSMGEFGARRFLNMERKPLLAYFVKRMLFGCAQLFWGVALRNIPKNGCGEDND